MSLVTMTFYNQHMLGRWELAQRLTQDKKIPEQHLLGFFYGSLGPLILRMNQQFNSRIEEKVWSNFSALHLTKYRGCYQLDYCDKILGAFANKDIEKMLDYQRKQVTKDIVHSLFAKANNLYATKEQKMMDHLLQLMNEDSQHLVGSLACQLEHEGIELRKPLGMSV
jgi:hypothetical protein